MRDAFLDGSLPGRDLLTLLVWGLVGTGLTSRTFQWE
jgi:hypothetical protein